MIHPGGQGWTDARGRAGGPVLDLISPRDLPAELTLSAAETAEMRDRLAALLAALEEPDPAQGRDRIAALLAGIAPTPAAPAAVGRTAIPADRAEVSDFDQYFGVRRIEADRPATLLLRGLAQTAAAVLALAARSPELPRNVLADQIRGFASQARLLGRICGTGEIG